MRRINTISLFAAAVALVAGTDSGAAEYTPLVMSEVWMVKMDADQDGKVSQAEYMTFGSNHLQKIRKPVDRRGLLDKFNGYDWNGDGFITDEDPLCPDPIAVFLEKIKGSWACENSPRGPACFTFMDGGEAEVVRNGLSLKDEAQGLLSYSIAHPGRNPVCIDIALGKGTPSEWHMKCICTFLEDNKIKLRVFMGDDATPFPAEFIQGDDDDTYYLTRVVKKEKPKPEPEPKPKLKPKSNSGELTLFGIPVPTGRR